MRDSVGGSVVIVIIVFFIVVALGYLAFNVNYMKAFRMKDKIISLYEDYDGVCTPKCKQAIANYATEIGYSTDGNINCPVTTIGNFERVDGLYCVQKVPILSNDDIAVAGDVKARYYYRIVTKINIQLPVISNVIDFRFFYISGDTGTFIG